MVTSDALTAKPEVQARKEIDHQLTEAGWLVQDRAAANPHAALGVAIREFPLKGGPVDYGLYVSGAVAGAVEAKKEGWTLSGVELQSQRYSQGLPDTLPAYRRPLPFLYESTGKETQFTNLLDPDPRSREVFTFHRPETHREWLQQAGYEQIRSLPNVAEAPAPYEAGATLRARLKTLPLLMTGGLWPPQITAINNVEESLAEDRPRSLIQMATGSGKTVRRGQPHLPPCEVRKGQADSLPGRSRQPGPPGAEGVRAVRHAGRRAQVQRAVRRPAPELERARPDRQGGDRHHPAALLDAPGRGGARPRRPMRSRASRRRRPSRRSRSRSPTTHGSRSRRST